MLIEIILFSLINAKNPKNQKEGDIDNHPLSTPEAIPLSIGLEQMNRTKDIKCTRNSCPNYANMAEGSYDINSPTFYRCGTTCNTSNGTFSYEFKGVKFGIIGTFSPDFYSFTVEVDGDSHKVDTHKSTRTDYSLLYVSGDLEYKIHKIDIKGTGEMFEIYKLVYWPSLHAKRLNSTEFEYRTGTWYTQSDMVGGIRQYATTDSTTETMKTQICASQVWFYGTKCYWCTSLDLTIGKMKTKLHLKQGGSRNDRFDTLLLYENDELEQDCFNITLETAGDATFNCIYYTEVSTPSEEIIKNEEDCEKRCQHVENEDKPVNVFINIATFTNLKEDFDGGAIYIYNAGLRCNKSTFDHCGSGNKVGGAIYLKNELNYASNAFDLDHLVFKYCQAKCGGAAFISSSSNLNTVNIKDCQFINNKATGSLNEEFYGGCAVYLSACNALISNNLFETNVGNGGAIKIVDCFDKDNNNALLLNNKKGSVVISKCSFVIHSDSDCSLFYIGGKHGSLVELKDSVFTGKLISGSHHINGMTIDKESPKLVVNNCRFASDAKKSFGNNDFLIVDLNNQIFEKNTKIIEKKMTRLTLFGLILISALTSVIFLLVMIVSNHNKLIESDTKVESIVPC